MITPELIAEHAHWSYTNFLVALAINVALTVVSNLIAGPRKIEGPRADLSRPQTADPGVVIPEIEGTGQMVAQFIWADNRGLNDGPTYEVKDTKTSGNLFTGKTKSTTYRYYSTFAVALCRTEHLPGGKIEGFRKIWANDKIIYDAEDVTTTSAQIANANLTTARTLRFGSTGVGIQTFFFTGEETQEPSSVIEVVEGDSPAYRGIAYIVFQQLDTTEWGGRVPTIRAEVVADGGTSEVEFQSYAPSKYKHVSNSTEPVERIHNGGEFGWNDSSDGTDYDSFSECVSNFPAPSYHQWWSNTGLGDSRWEDGNDNPELTNGDYRIYLPAAVLDAIDSGFPWQYGGTDANAEYSTPYEVHINRKLCAAIIVVRSSDPPPGPGWSFKGNAQTTGLDAYLYIGMMAYRRNQLFCGYSCPIGDPIEAGEPVVLPDAPQFCVDRNGDISLNSGKVIVSETFKTLKHWEFESAGVNWSLADVESDPGGPDLLSIARGPVLLHTDPDYDNQEFWESAAARAGVTGTYNIDFPVEVFNVCGSTLTADSIAPNAILLKEIIKRDVARVEPTITESDLEFVGLDTYTVDGRVLTEMSSPADRLAEIEEVFKVDCVPVDGKLRFVRRASAPEIAVNFSEFGAFIPGSQPPKPLDETRPNNVELPRFTNLIYYGIDVHAQDKQTAERTTVAAVGERTINSAFTFDAQQAKDVVEVIHQSQWAELYGRVKFTLSMAHSNIIPSDWITTNDGNRDIKIRITYQKVLSNGLIEFEGIIDRKANYTAGAFGVAEQLASGLQALGLAGPTIMRVLNLPNLQDSHDTPGHYVAVAPLLSGWNGATLQESFDDASWDDLTDLEEPAIIGTILNTLASSDGLTVEESAYVDIALPEWQTPTTPTDREFYNGEYPIIVNNELILYRDVTDNGDGSWRFSCLIRGWRSTEGSSHAPGDTAVVGRPAFIENNDTEIGATKYYRAVTFGTDADSTYSHEFTNNGETVDEFGVVDVVGTRNTDPDDLTVTFRAQKRLGKFLNDYQHSNLFTGYEADVMDSGSIVRTLASSTEEFLYTKAQQLDDFGSAQSSVTLRIYTVNSYGRGDVTEVTV